MAEVPVASLEPLSRCTEFPRWPAAFEGGVAEGICHLCAVEDWKGCLCCYCPARALLTRGNDCSRGYWSVQKLICKHLSWICFCSEEKKKKKKDYKIAVWFLIKGCIFKIFTVICRIFSIKGDTDNTAVNKSNILHKRKICSSICLNVLQFFLFENTF